MLTRQIPSTGESIPCIGLGTWQAFDPPSLDGLHLKRLSEVLATFYAAGGRVVDTSPMYGRAEQILGLLSSRLGINDRLFLATKVWTQGEAAGTQQLHESLEKLHRPSLELVQIHNLIDWRTHLRTLLQWKEKRPCRYIGLTHYQVAAFPDLEWILHHERVDFVQLPYSMGLRHAEKRLLPLAQDRGVAVLVNRPLEEGSLLRRVRDQPLPDLAAGFASSWSQVFLKFILAHPAVTCVIPATSNPEHAQDNAQAGEGRLPSEDERKELSRLIGATARSVRSTLAAVPRRARYWLRDRLEAPRP